MDDAKQVRHEHSAGGCVYRQSKWLLGKHSGYHKWVLPKGLIEKGETSQVTALREVEEEMGVKANIVGEEPIWIEEYVYWAEYKPEKEVTEPTVEPVRRVKTYQENKDFEKKMQKVRVFKKVDFYLMEWVSGKPEDHDWEMEEAGWFTYAEAMERLGFEGEKKALRQAQGKLLK